MTAREEAEKIVREFTDFTVDSDSGQILIPAITAALQSRDDQLKAAREVIESLVNIEGIAWMNHRTTDVALRKAREWLEKNKENQE